VAKCAAQKRTERQTVLEDEALQADTAAKPAGGAAHRIVLQRAGLGLVGAGAGAAAWASGSASELAANPQNSLLPAPFLAQELPMHAYFLDAPDQPLTPVPRAQPAAVAVSR